MSNKKQPSKTIFILETIKSASNRMFYFEMHNCGSYVYSLKDTDIYFSFDYYNPRFTVKLIKDTVTAAKYDFDNIKAALLTYMEQLILLLDTAENEDDVEQFQLVAAIARSLYAAYSLE